MIIHYVTIIRIKIEMVKVMILLILLLNNQNNKYIINLAILYRVDLLLIN